MYRVIILLFVLSSAIALAASTLVPIPPLHAQPTTPAKPGGTWRTHACADCVLTLVPTRDTVWVGTMSGGVVRHDRRTGAVRQFTREDGLGGNAVVFMAVSPDGHVWATHRASTLISPPTGISHFDGQKWQAFDTVEGASVFTPVFPGFGGTAWIASDAGLFHFDGRRWGRFPVTDGLPGGRLSSVAVAPDATVWVGGEQGMATFDGRRWVAAPLDGLDSTSVAPIAVDASGIVWAKVEGGVARFNPLKWPSGTNWEAFSFPPPPPDAVRLYNSQSIVIDEGGAVWFMQGLEAFRFDGHAWSPVSAAVDHSRATPGIGTAIAVDPAGDLWLGRQSRGMARWDGKVWTEVETHLAPSNMIAFSVAIAPDDQLWTGFMPLLDHDNIINRYDGSRWARSGEADGMLRSGTLGVVQNALDVDASGTTWVGVGGMGIAWYDGQRWAKKAITDVVGAGARIRSVDADDRGGVWAGTGLGAVHYDGRTWRVLTSTDGLPLNDVLAVRADPRPGSKVVWFGTDAGLTRWDGRAWRTFTTADGLASNRVYDIALDPRTGDLWLVTGPAGGGGVTRFDGRRGHVFTTADGLAANNAWDIEVDAWGEVWVATAEDNTPPGISRFDGQQWFVYTTADGLIENIAWDLAIDSKGTVWIATIAGLSEFRTDRVPAPELTPTAEPEPGPCICGIVQGRVPRAAIDAAVANPASVGGWQQPLDPGKPVGPFNLRRECLSLSRSSVPYHPLYNGLEWRAGCP